MSDEVKVELKLYSYNGIDFVSDVNLVPSTIAGAVQSLNLDISVKIYVLRQIRSSNFTKVYEEFARYLKKKRDRMDDDDFIFIMIVHPCDIPCVKALRGNILLFHIPKPSLACALSNVIWDFVYLSRDENQEEKRVYNSLSYPISTKLSTNHFQYHHRILSIMQNNEIDASVVTESNILPFLNRRKFKDSLRDDTMIYTAPFDENDTKSTDKFVNYCIKQRKRIILMLAFGHIDSLKKYKKRVYEKFGLNALRNVYISPFAIGANATQVAQIVPSLHYASDAYFVSNYNGTRLSILEETAKNQTPIYPLLHKMDSFLLFSR